MTQTDAVADHCSSETPGQAESTLRAIVGAIERTGPHDPGKLSLLYEARDLCPSDLIRAQRILNEVLGAEALLDFKTAPAGMARQKHSGRDPSTADADAGQTSSPRTVSNYNSAGGGNNDVALGPYNSGAALLPNDRNLRVQPLQPQPPADGAYGPFPSPDTGQMSTWQMLLCDLLQLAGSGSGSPDWRYVQEQLARVVWLSQQDCVAKCTILPIELHNILEAGRDVQELQANLRTFVLEYSRPRFRSCVRCSAQRLVHSCSDPPSHRFSCGHPSCVFPLRSCKEGGWDERGDWASLFPPPLLEAAAWDGGGGEDPPPKKYRRLDELAEYAESPAPPPEEWGRGHFLQPPRGGGDDSPALEDEGPQTVTDGNASRAAGMGQGPGTGLSKWRTHAVSSPAAVSGRRTDAGAEAVAGQLKHRASVIAQSQECGEEAGEELVDLMPRSKTFRLRSARQQLQASEADMSDGDIVNSDNEAHAEAGGEAHPNKHKDSLVGPPSVNAWVHAPPVSTAIMGMPPAARRAATAAAASVLRCSVEPTSAWTYPADAAAAATTGEYSLRRGVVPLLNPHSDAKAIPVALAGGCDMGQRPRRISGSNAAASAWAEAGGAVQMDNGRSSCDGEGGQLWLAVHPINLQQHEPMYDRNDRPLDGSSRRGASEQTTSGWSGPAAAAPVRSREGTSRAADNSALQLHPIQHHPHHHLQEQQRQYQSPHPHHQAPRRTQLQQQPIQRLQRAHDGKEFIATAAEADEDDFPPHGHQSSFDGAGATGAYTLVAQAWEGAGPGGSGSSGGRGDFSLYNSSASAWHGVGNGSAADVVAQKMSHESAPTAAFPSGGLRSRRDKPPPSIEPNGLAPAPRTYRLNPTTTTTAAAANMRTVAFSDASQHQPLRRVALHPNPKRMSSGQANSSYQNPHQHPRSQSTITGLQYAPRAVQSSDAHMADAAALEPVDYDGEVEEPGELKLPAAHSFESYRPNAAAVIAAAAVAAAAAALGLPPEESPPEIITLPDGRRAVVLPSTPVFDVRVAGPAAPSRRGAARTRQAQDADSGQPGLSGPAAASPVIGKRTSEDGVLMGGDMASLDVGSGGGGRWRSSGWADASTGSDLVHDLATDLYGISSGPLTHNRSRRQLSQQVPSSAAPVTIDYDEAEPIAGSTKHQQHPQQHQQQHPQQPPPLQPSHSSRAPTSSHLTSGLLETQLTVTGGQAPLLGEPHSPPPPPRGVQQQLQDRHSQPQQEQQLQDRHSRLQQQLQLQDRHSHPQQQLQLQDRHSHPQQQLPQESSKKANYQLQQQQQQPLQAVGSSGSLAFRSSGATTPLLATRPSTASSPSTMVFLRGAPSGTLLSAGTSTVVASASGGPSALPSAASQRVLRNMDDRVYLVEPVLLPNSSAGNGAASGGDGEGSDGVATALTPPPPALPASDREAALVGHVESRGGTMAAALAAAAAAAAATSSMPPQPTSSGHQLDVIASNQTTMGAPAVLPAGTRTAGRRPGQASVPSDSTSGSGATNDGAIVLMGTTTANYGASAPSSSISSGIRLSSGVLGLVPKATPAGSQGPVNSGCSGGSGVRRLLLQPIALTPSELGVDVRELPQVQTGSVVALLPAPGRAAAAKAAAMSAAAVAAARTSLALHAAVAATDPAQLQPQPSSLRSESAIAAPRHPAATGQAVTGKAASAASDDRQEVVTALLGSGPQGQMYIKEEPEQEIVAAGPVRQGGDSAAGAAEDAGWNPGALRLSPRLTAMDLEGAPTSTWLSYLQEVLSLAAIPMASEQPLPPPTFGYKLTSPWQVAQQDRNAVLEWSARVTLRGSSNYMCSASAVGRSCSNSGCGAPPGHGGFRRSSSGPSAYSPFVLGTSFHVPGDVVLLSVCGSLPTHLAQLIPPELPVADVRLRKDIPVTVTKPQPLMLWASPDSTPQQLEALTRLSLIKVGLMVHLDDHQDFIMSPQEIQGSIFLVSVVVKREGAHGSVLPRSAVESSPPGQPQPLSASTGPAGQALPERQKPAAPSASDGPGPSGGPMTRS